MREVAKSYERLKIIFLLNCLIRVQSYKSLIADTDVGCTTIVRKGVGYLMDRLTTFWIALGRKLKRNT